MKKRGILNAALAEQIAALGHKDMFLVGDAGMPIPKGVPVIDLAVTLGVPTFRQVLDAILDETEVEGFILADEIQTYNPTLKDYLEAKLAGKDETYISHEKLKQQSAQVKFAVRTGECTPYPNVILRAGVVF